MKPIIEKERLLELLADYDISNRFFITSAIEKLGIDDPAVSDWALAELYKHPQHHSLLHLLRTQTLTSDHLPKLAEIYSLNYSNDMSRMMINDIIFNLPKNMQNELLSFYNAGSKEHSSLKTLIDGAIPLPEDAQHLLETLRTLCIKYDSTRSEQGMLECRYVLNNLKKHKDSLKEQVCNLASEDYSSNYLFEEYMVELCGIWGINESATALVAKLGEDTGDFFPGIIMRAIGRIGDESVLPMLKEGYFRVSEDARGSFSEALSYFPTEEAEEILLYMFERETEPREKTAIACSLADIFSKKAIEPIIKFAESGDFDFDMTSPLELLEIVYKYHRIQIPEELRRLDSEIVRQRLEHRQSVMMRSAAKKMMQESDVVKRTKIGRNDPCPCGSGKKFKKCCMG